jgi:hypothetical protein
MGFRGREMLSLDPDDGNVGLNGELLQGAKQN